MKFEISWFQEHLLSVVAITITIILIYHYLIERDYGIKLSKKYRGSIFEAQSKIFLNASQYLIIGNKDLAIREFLNAVDLNRETLETYFALGGLFRSNGEIEKAISIHRSLIARDNISEEIRLRALKELALDFDKGGFIEKAVETYRDVLKVNRDQVEVINSLCRIYEDIEDWDQALNFRMMLSKVGNENQAETISHILVQKAKQSFEQGKFSACIEDLDEAFKFAPSVSAKILKLKVYLINGSMEEAQILFFEILKEHPMYASFLFISLMEGFKGELQSKNDYEEKLKILRIYFLNLKDEDLDSSPSVILSKIRLLKELGKLEEALVIVEGWVLKNRDYNDVLKVEYIKLLVELGKKEEVMEQSYSFFNNLHQTLTRHFCSQCGFNSDDIFWRCPQCHMWETIQFRWKV